MDMKKDNAHVVILCSVSAFLFCVSILADKVFQKTFSGVDVAVSKEKVNVNDTLKQIDTFYVDKHIQKQR